MLALAVVILGAAIWIIGQGLPALAWTGFARGASSVLHTGGGGDPLEHGDMLLIVSRGAIVFGVIALVARARGRRRVGLVAASAATAAAIVWAVGVPANVESVHHLALFSVDYGAITVHPWIWVPAYGHAVVLFGLILWTLVPAARPMGDRGEGDLPVSLEP